MGTGDGAAGLQLVLCERWEELCGSVAANLAEPLADPFTGQLVVVDAPAIRRALTAELASRLGGICAGVDAQPMRALRRRLEAGLLGLDERTDPWRTRGLTLALLEMMDECAGQEWFWPLARHLGDPGARPGRRLATAGRVARLLLRAAHHRPQMLRQWEAGELVGPHDAALPSHQLWQPKLWTAVCERLDAPSPLARHDTLVSLIASGAPLGLDEELVRLVCPTPASPLDRELVGALAQRVPVHLWQLDPAAGGGGFAEHWGVAGRTGVERWRAMATSVELLPAPPPQASTTLVRLQAETAGRAMAAPLAGAVTEPDGLPVGPTQPDGSVQLHASHGLDRQVEVLREVLCGLLEDDPTLEPREVVVACTDLDAAAPLVRAAFCLDDEALGEQLHPGHRLRVALADSSLGRRNDVLECLRMLVQLASSRATAQDLVDLCASPPVAARFQLGPDDLERIRRLVGAADIRWGLDRRHREQFGLGQVPQSTWLAGIERILVGVAMGPHPPRWLGTALPVEQLDSSDVLAAGALAEIISRCRRLVAQWAAPATTGQWAQRLRQALAELVATDQEDAWQLAAAHTELADLADLTRSRTGLVGLGELASGFDQLLRGGGGRANFGNGSLVVCRLADLGQVGRRVVVVLGLDEQYFPARPQPDGDDLVAWSAPDPEDDPRTASRQYLLDALGAARERLVVIHQGFSARTNEPVPPSVAVVDLARACLPHGGVQSFQHSLQPHSPENFVVERARRPSSFDRSALLGARSRQIALAATPVAAPALWQQQLGIPGDKGPVEALEMDALLDFYRHPARELLRRTLGVTMTEYDDELADEIPVEPSGLDEWQIGDRMVRLALDGLEPEELAAAERLRGALPPGALGSRTLARLMPQVGKVVAAAQRERIPAARDLDCDLRLDPRCGADALTGRLRVHQNSIVHHAFSRTSATHLLQAWFELLLLAATHPAPSSGWRSVHIGRDAIATLVAPPPDRCRELLAELVALRAQGLVQLVPLPPRTAAEFTGTTPLRPFANHDPERSARRSFGQEHDADWACFVDDDLDLLRRIPRLGGDPGIPGPSRFENLSDWLFAPVREQLSVGNLR